MGHHSHQALDLLVREDLSKGQKMDRFRHAVKTTNVAAVRDTDPQACVHAAETVDKWFVNSHTRYDKSDAFALSAVLTTDCHILHQNFCHAMVEFTARQDLIASGFFRGGEFCLVDVRPKGYDGFRRARKPS